MTSPTNNDALGDAELLHRFVREWDQAAFTLLVEKHAQLVFGVCRRVLHNEQDVEDAFQATFMILAKRAASIKTRDSIVTWLFTVTQRTSRAIASKNARRRQAESKYDRPQANDVFEQIQQRELLNTVFEELEALPAKYKAPLLLCIIGGVTRRAAAEELNCTEPAIKARLSRGRELLQKRLRKRHVLPSTALVLIGITTASIAPALLKQSIAASVAGSHPAGNFFSSLMTATYERTGSMIFSIPGKQYTTISVSALTCFIICVLSMGIFQKAKTVSAASVDAIELETRSPGTGSHVLPVLLTQEEDEEAKKTMPSGTYTLAFYQGESSHLTYIKLENNKGVLQLIQADSDADPLEGKIDGRKIKFYGTRQSRLMGNGPIEYVGELVGENKDRVIGKWTWKVDGEQLQSGKFKVLPGKWSLGPPEKESKPDAIE